MNIAYVVFDFVINLLVNLINIILIPINMALGILIPNFDIVTLNY